MAFTVNNARYTAGVANLHAQVSLLGGAIADAPPCRRSQPRHFRFPPGRLPLAGTSPTGQVARAQSRPDFPFRMRNPPHATATATRSPVAGSGVPELGGSASFRATET